MATTGTVKNYNPFKGFGFITGTDGQDVFVHVSACNGMAPNQGDVVTYDVSMNDKTGKPNASNVQGCTGSAEAAKGGGKGAAGTGTCAGTVKSYSGEKGWGFVEYNGQDIFLHIKNCNGGTPQSGDWLTFDVADAVQGNGKLMAVNISGCTGWSEKGKGKGKGGKGDKGGYGAMWGGGKGDWGKGGGWGAGPYGGGKGGGWGKDAGWGTGGW